MIKRRSFVNFSKAGRIVIALTIAFVIVFPLFWMFISSFRPNNEFMIYPPRLFPSLFTLEQYIEVINTIPIITYFKNTVIYAFATAAANLLFCSMAGYAFGRLNFKGKNVLFTLMLMTMMVPYQIVLIPLYMQLNFFGMLNSYAGLIVPRMTSAIGVFLVRGFFVALPKDLEEAARIDGLSELGIYFRIMLPLCTPIMVTLAVLSISAGWNDLIWPLIVTNSSEMRTLPSGLAMFVGTNTTNYGPAFAGAVISVIPLLIAYIFGQKYFVNSIANTGIKD